MKSLEKKTIPKLASEYECTACLACENICPKHAIAHFTAEDGHVYTRIDSDQCIGCLKCQNVCVASRNCVGVNDLTRSKLYAGWTQNDELRKAATSGGVFAALAETVLRNGGCVIGAELCGFECKQVMIDRICDINRLQGSKYMASSMEDVYKILRRELPTRDVLFTGLGCQCAGVLSILPEIKTSHRLYTIDLVCGGMPSRLLIDRFREEYQNVTRIISFRTKDKYELKVQTESGVRVLTEKSLPLHGFNCGMTNRYNCYNCQFAKAHRKTDVTIGDLWDYMIKPEEHKAGISMIIVHSQNGSNLINCSNLTKEEIGWSGVLLHNKRIVCGHKNIYLPRKKLTINYESLSKTRFKKLYTITMSPSDIDLFLFRIIRYIIEKCNARQNEKYIKNLLSKLSAMPDMLEE